MMDDEFDVWDEDEGVCQQGGGEVHGYNAFPVEDFVEDMAYMAENSKEQWRDISPTAFIDNIRATVDDARHQTFELCKQEREYVLAKVKEKLGRRSEKSLLNVVNIFLGEESKVWKAIEVRINQGIKRKQDRMTHLHFFKCVMTLFVTGAYGQVRVFGKDCKLIVASLIEFLDSSNTTFCF
jgi:hypothetical protein